MVSSLTVFRHSQIKVAELIFMNTSTQFPNKKRQTSRMEKKDFLFQCKEYIKIEPYRRSITRLKVFACVFILKQPNYVYLDQHLNLPAVGSIL